MFHYYRETYQVLDIERNLELKPAGGTPDFNIYRLIGPGWEIKVNGSRRDSAALPAQESITSDDVLWTLQAMEIGSGGPSAPEAKELVREAVFCIETEFNKVPPDKLYIRV